MNLKSLSQQIKIKESFLCVGLDIDLSKIPSHILNEKDPIFVFSKSIIDATHKYAVAYKPNLAFFEAYGIEGWKAFEKTIDYINKNYPNHFIIADAKRGDIGNTSGRYAKAFFETYGVDAVTISPYMGRDSIEPFLSFKDKYAVLLTLTSNEGSRDFQYIEQKGVPVYEKVLRLSTKFENAHKLMYVVGATKSENLKLPSQRSGDCIRSSKSNISALISYWKSPKLIIEPDQVNGNDLGWSVIDNIWPSHFKLLFTVPISLTSQFGILNSLLWKWSAV